jgi:ABC-type uncharacterized transport system involved in gliding motility auxiliary subunit
LLFCFAWFSRLYSAQIDLTENTSNTLSGASQQILATLPESISITVYTKEAALQKQIAQLLEQYRHFKKNISINFINPDLNPEKTRELNIGNQGAIIVKYQGRTEKINYLSETTLSNALLQLANSKERQISILTGHGERSATGTANFDFGLFGKQLEQHKITLQTVNLAKTPGIPDNSSLLILTSPVSALLPGEFRIIDDYIEQGKNLLLLTEPDNQRLIAIEQKLGIRKLPGTIADSYSGLYGIDDPTFVLVSEYPDHAITQNFSSISVFPVTAALELDEESQFNAKVFLASVLDSWTETGKINKKIHFNADSNEREGPLNIAYALTRQFSDKNQQRIAVIGDGDFLSNAYIGHVGNSEFGFRLINWLTHDDQLIEIPSKITTGDSLQFSNLSIALIGFSFLVLLPFLLLFTGFIIWRKRKRR